MNIHQRHRKPLPFFLLVFSLLAGSLQQTTAQSYGLAFSSHEVIPEQRTSLDITHSGAVCFTSHLDLSFELSFAPDFTTYFGYIFRLINDRNQNIDLIYDQHKLNFRLVNQEEFTDINFEIDPAVLFGGWTKISFTLDAAKGITCTVNNKVWRANDPGLKSKCFKIIFGTSSEHNFISSDVPPMRLRNIALSTDDSKQYFWSLNELAGTTSTDSIANKTAKVVNPGWIKPKHNNWQLVRSLTIKGWPSVAFNERTEELYLAGNDTLYTFRAKGTRFDGTALSSPGMNLLPGNQSIVNQHTGKLYNFYTDQQLLTEYDFARNAWDRHFTGGPTTEHWQVNKFFSGDTSLFILCGYGQLKYKNTIRRVNPNTGTWTTVQPQGDFLAPRYLSAVGTTASGKTAYILGGFGSREGDQLLSPRHFYDLLRYDVETNTISKVYSLPEPAEQFVFGNSLVIDEVNQNYYALTFPNSRFNTQLQLIKGSLNSPSYTLLGQPFPYSFTDVRSFADLFYCKKANQLLAVTLYTIKDQGTEVKIFSINFPPNENNAVAVNGKNAGSRSSSSLLFILAGAGLLVTVSVFVFIARRKKKRTTPASPVQLKTGKEDPVHAGEAVDALTTALTKPATDAMLPVPAMASPDDAYGSISAPVNRILLFGNFEVITADGQNMTKQFTPLLKEMFLLILIHSLRYKKGVSAEKLNDILWNDKDIKDAKNNRSVNLVKLKNILDKVGGCSISRKTGAWQFEYDPALVHVDFNDYLELVNNQQLSEPSLRATQLIGIVKGGGFLPEKHYEWLDNIKGEISNYVIELLVSYSEHLDIQAEPEKIIEACEVITSFDELNEHALKLKCKSLIALGRHTLAKAAYTKFAAKYKEIYGEEYKQAYNSLLNP